MKRILLALAGLMLAGGTAHAQTANVVTTCGTITYDNAGTAIPRPLTQDTGGNLCTGASAAPTGGATAANQTNVQATPGSDATKAVAVQGVTSGKPLASKVADGDDTTLGAKADAKSTATDTTAITAMQVWKQISASVQAPPSQAVTNAGTFAVQATTQASQNGIGNVGGKTVRVCVAPTVTSATYGANVVMGGLLSFANLFTSTGSGIIQSISIDFTTVQSVGFKLYPFTSNPSNTTWTEHSAASINSADIFKVDPFISMTNYDGGLGTMTNYSLTGLGQSYSSGGTTGYFILVPTATTATLGGTANVVQVCVTVIQDL
jgi:hypothetical protein